jgi:hypothetical protein
MTDTEHKMTPTERLHDLAMAAITKQARDASSLEISGKQGSVGPMANVWHCDGLKVKQRENETDLETAARYFDVAQMIQRHNVELNAGRLSDELQATLNAKVKK